MPSFARQILEKKTKKSRLQWQRNSEKKGKSKERNREWTNEVSTDNKKRENAFRHTLDEQDHRQS